MRRYPHFSPITIFHRWIHALRYGSNMATAKKEAKQSEIEAGRSIHNDGGNGISENGYHPFSTLIMDVIPKDINGEPLSKAKRDQVETYLYIFRGFILTPKERFDLKADIVPYEQGAVMRIVFASTGGINYWQSKNNLLEACQSFKIDIEHYNSQIQTDKPEHKREYIIVEDKKILYVIKTFDTPKSWTLGGIKQDIAGIKALSESPFESKGSIITINFQFKIKGWLAGLYYRFIQGNKKKKGN